MAEKETILILSYYFPPCNLTPSERIYSWAKYLKNGNYYPVIVTRNWDIDIKNSTTDAFKPAGDKVKIEYFDDYEVHYLPYRSSLKDLLLIKLEGTKFYFIYLIFAFIYSIIQLAFVRYSTYSFFYAYLNNFLKNRTKIQKMVVSASPFELFGIAHLLQKKYKISWIADYRDDWSTNEMQYADSFPKRLLLHVYRYYEKKYLKSCSCFTTVSTYYNKKIGALIQKKGYLLENGFMPENYRDSLNTFENFTISYTGSIYNAQPIELFLNGVKSFIDKKKDVKINIYFIGVANELAVLRRLERNIINYESYFKFTNRISKKEAIEIQARSHMLLACAYSDLRGIPGSKLYEYIALKKPVIVYPSDEDVIERTLTATGQGLICRNESDFIRYLNEYYEYYEKNKDFTNMQFNHEEINKYSREKQSAALLKALNEINNGK